MCKKTLALDKEAAYQDFVEWLARLNPREVISYEPNEETKERVQELILKQSADKLSEEEKAELDNFYYLESMLGLAKARAHQLLRA